MSCSFAAPRALTVFRKSAQWLAVPLFVLLAASCGSPDLAEEAGAGSQRALVAGDTYFSTNEDGERSTKEWVEGRVVNVNGLFQIVQPQGYDGPPVFVDDAFKATMDACDAPAGSTWTSSDGESGQWKDGDIGYFADGSTCVYRTRSLADGSTTDPANASADPQPATTEVVPSPTPRPEPTVGPTAEPTVEPELVGFGRLEPQQHTTSVSEVYFSLPAPVGLEEEEFRALGYSNFHYEFAEGDQQVLVTIADIGGFFSDAEEREFEENIATRSKSGAENEADLLNAFGTVRGLERTGDGRAVTIMADGEEHPGYEVDVVVEDRLGHLRYFRRDGVKFTQLALGLNSLEWQEVSESVRFESTYSAEEPEVDIELTPEEQAEEDAALERLVELVGDRSFVDGPYEARDLEPMTGGWGYVDAPPFGAVEPGEDSELDARWVECREGDGFACDTLILDAPVNSSYQRFGLTCGGRSRSADCSELLGSDLHPGFLRPYNDTDDFFRDRTGGYRLDRIPGPDSPPPGNDPIRDLLWAECGIEGSGSACRRLSNDLESIPDIYEAYGLSCGGRRVFASMDCFSMLRDDADKIPAGSPAPGTFDAEADRLWVTCDNDAVECFRFIVFSLGVDSDRRDDFSPYNTFGNSCGGEYERPLTELTLRGGCRVPYAEIDTIADTSELPDPPVG